jgi:DNA-binding MurR/RpiR family transcriptional regulator
MATGNCLEIADTMSIRKAETERPSSNPPARDVIEELRQSYDQFTQSQKRIAEYIVEHAQAVAFSTVDQMAAQLDVNPSTIVRFTYRLGLNGFPDLQERMREIVRGQLARTGDPINEGHVAGLEATSFGASLSHDWQNLRHTIANLDAGAFDRAVQILAHARRIYVVGGFSTFAVAHYFATVLAQLRSNVSLLASNDTSEALRLVEIEAEDCVLAFTFPRYAEGTRRIVEWAKQYKAKVVAVTDSPITAVGQLADVVVLALAAGTGLHNSMVAPIAVANALLNAFAAAEGATALERYARSDRLMHRWDVFLRKSDGTE